MRLDWTGISPSLKSALRTLARNISLKSDHTYKTPHWNGLEGKDLEDRILHLIARGKTLKAIALVKINYGYDISKAKLFVDDLAEK